MKNKNILYHEVHPLPLNVFLLFYVYVFFVLIVANLLPVAEITYFLFLAFGIAGICTLLVKYKYHISIKENTIVVSITVPFKISLLKLKVKEIKTLEEIAIDPITYYGYGIMKYKPCSTAYLFIKENNGIKLTMSDGKIFIISCSHADRIIAYINASGNKEKYDKKNGF